MNENLKTENVNQQKISVSFIAEIIAYLLHNSQKIPKNK